MMAKRNFQIRRVHPLTVIATAIVVALIVFVVSPQLLSSSNASALDILHRLKSPSWQHPFGTDEAGRDIFTRVIFGTRYSLGIAIGVVFIGAVFGVIYGAVSGMANRTVDALMMRIVDLFLGFPALVLALAMSAAIGRGLGSVLLSLTIIWWPGYARMVRGEVLRLKELPHVEAARALGVSSVNILRRHIIPFVTDEVNVRVTTDIGYALVAVTALSFLGLGATSPTPEWGLLIRDARPYFSSAPWYLIFPGLMVMLTSAAFSILGDAIAGKQVR